jgi:hypothetical protein
MWQPRPVDISDFQVVPRLADYPENILDAIPEITEICFVKENTTPSDVIFVFGAKPRPQYIDKVRQVIEGGISRNLILTGGISHHEKDKTRHEPESEILHRQIKDCTNYNAMTIYQENTSGDSFENITEAQKIFDFSKVKSISIVGLHYASQRQLQSFKSYMPDFADKTFYYLPYQHVLNDHLITPNAWHLHEDSRRLVWGEIVRLYQYADQGYIRLDDNIKIKIQSLFDKLDIKPE